MRPFRAIVTVRDPDHVVLPRVPFEAGEKVEITVTPRKTRETAGSLRQLLKETQSLPQVRSISDEDIAAEVRAHRNKR